MHWTTVLSSKLIVQFFEGVTDMYKVVVFIPESRLEAVKQAMFAAGAGKMGRYDQCCWQTLGAGQFCPMEGSNPFVGEQGRVETVAEYRVEMICEEPRIGSVLAALKDAHPYEHPAYDVIRLEDL